jgi:two-component system OmpR family sensor kinase/two-component system sensor histidine kinase BaeS
VLVCCIPFVVVFVIFLVIFNLYTRYGQPLRRIFAAIEAVSKGDLSVRVPDDSSPQFGELIKRFNQMVVDLERADQQRRNLTADIAHELRTPLHIIQGKLEGMQDGVYEATAANVNDALDETKLLGRLVDDLQTLSLAEGGQLPLHKTQFAAAELLRSVESSFAAAASAASVELTTEVSDANMVLEADFVRLSQVLGNLVTNALRFTPAGGKIALRAAAIDGRIRIEVSDTGAGISADDLPFVFDRFWRGEKSRTRDGQASSGLGLAIVRQLVLAHNGTIDLRSELGKGTTFVIELPAAASA